MNQQVFISVRGEQRPVSDPGGEPIVALSACEGKYRRVGGRHHVVYEEKRDGENRATKTHITAEEGHVEVHRSGHVENVMVFERGLRSSVPYRTPFGTISMETRTKSLEYEEKEDRIHVMIRYELFAGGEKVSSNKTEIEIRNL